MSHEPNSDQIVTRWVDEGPEVAPERFVWAALEQVERTPQRGSRRVALENTPMFLKFAVPALGAAAAIVLAMVIYGNLNPAPSGTPSDTPLPSPAAIASPERDPRSVRPRGGRDSDAGNARCHVVRAPRHGSGGRAVHVPGAVRLGG